MKQDHSNLISKQDEILNSNIEAVRSVTALVRSTIGPKGLDMMLVDEFANSIISNDGYEILSNLQIKHPAAKFALEACQSQELSIGDGTTTTAIFLDSILAASQLRITDKSKINQIISGLNKAKNKTIELLKQQSQNIENTYDDKLKALVKISARGNNEITNLVIEAAKKNSHLIDCKEANFDLSQNVHSRVNAQGKIIDGFIIKKKSHFDFKEDLNDAKILLVEGPFEPDPMSSEAASTNEGVKKFDSNVQSLLETAKRIAKAGIKAVFTSSSMFIAAEELLSKEGILVLTHVKKTDLNALEFLAKTRLYSRNFLFQSEIKNFEDLSGKLASISKNLELDAFIFKSINEKHSLYSILVGAETETQTQEIKRITIDACRSLKAAYHHGYLLGEGVAELNLIKELKSLKVKDNESLGLEIMIEALQAPFIQILENAGLNANELIQEMDFSLDNKFGIDLDSGEKIKLEEAGIIDALELKISAIKIATTVACQILRITNIIQAK